MRRHLPEQSADLCDVGFAGRTGQQVVMPDAVETVGQDMDQEPPDELVSGESNDGSPIAIPDATILPAKGDGLGVSADQAGVRDGDAVDVAAKVGEDRLWAAEGRFGVDHPFGFMEWCRPGGECGDVGQSRLVAEVG